jgi:hypothetical protein
MMSRLNNQDQNRPCYTGFPPVVSSVTAGTVARRGLVLTHEDELLQMTLQLLQMTIELLQLQKVALDEISRDTHANYLKARSQQI